MKKEDAKRVLANMSDYARRMIETYIVWSKADVKRAADRSEKQYILLNTEDAIHGEINAEETAGRITAEEAEALKKYYTKQIETRYNRIK